jgi:hypothetical protein
MTLQRAIRAYSAAARRSERASQRRTREAARQFRVQQKEQQLQDAAKAVGDYNEYIAVLKSIHVDATSDVDWHAIQAEKQPSAPIYSNAHEQAARDRFLAYKPSFLDKIFGLTKRKISKFETEVATAIEKDKLEFEQENLAYQNDLEDWRQLQAISKGILEKDIHAYAAAIKFFKPFEEMSEIGSRIEFQVTPNNVTADLHLNSDKLIPDFVLTLTSTGKLSRRNISTSKYNELYQDYVCSCILRIAREMFAHLPVNLVAINAINKQIDSATGIMGQYALVSVAIHRSVLKNIHFASIDPSDSMKNFTCNMKFSKSTGFAIVPKLDAGSIVSYKPS